MLCYSMMEGKLSLCSEYNRRWTYETNNLPEIASRKACARGDVSVMNFLMIVLANVKNEIQYSQVTKIKKTQTAKG